MVANGKKTKLKEPVKVRTKKLADGSESYYLDIYVDGKRQYEFLKLYRLPEKRPCQGTEQGYTGGSGDHQVKTDNRTDQQQSRTEEHIRQVKDAAVGLDADIL